MCAVSERLKIVSWRGRRCQDGSDDSGPLPGNDDWIRPRRLARVESGEPPSIAGEPTRAVGRLVQAEGSNSLGAAVSIGCGQAAAGFRVLRSRTRNESRLRDESRRPNRTLLGALDPQHAAHGALGLQREDQPCARPQGSSHAQHGCVMPAQTYIASTFGKSSTMPDRACTTTWGRSCKFLRAREAKRGSIS